MQELVGKHVRIERLYPDGTLHLYDGKVERVDGVVVKIINITMRDSTPTHVLDAQGRETDALIKPVDGAMWINMTASTTQALID